MIFLIFRTPGGTFQQDFTSTAQPCPSLGEEEREVAFVKLLLSTLVGWPCDARVPGARRV